MYDAIIIGCGAAGMMSGITLAERGKKVIILEKNEKPGKKLFITGKGRCNLTNNCEKDELFKNVVSNSKFMYSAFNSFDSKDTIDFFENNLGLKTKTERGNRAFPVSDHSSDVISALYNRLKKLDVEILFNSCVTKINYKIYEEENNDINEEGENYKYNLSDEALGKNINYKKDKTDKNKTEKYVTGVEYTDENGKKELLNSYTVIVATGGISYPRTGSTGDGLRWAKELDLKVTEPVPALVPLVVKEEDICRELMGLSLKNVKVTFTALKNGKRKEIYSDFGEMLFTHFGVSGPIILSASSYLAKYYDKEPELNIDLKPALSREQLDARLLRDFEENNNKQFQNALDKLLPKSLIPVIIRLTEIDEHKKVNSVSKAERLRLLDILKDFKLTITGSRGFDEAIITQGGVSVKEINPSTMECKKVKGLKFIGEVLDVDALTGGFNLQIAWSTARMAAETFD
ncbi:MAG: NAD(P)/FAD-dependent oxidoreductase [Lachnospiraceae bacterium]|nr:NAD(P)/FAD-dependent oxidoreductase [Lachnospiraceae bacterium]